MLLVTCYLPVRLFNRLRCSYTSPSLVRLKSRLQSDEARITSASIKATKMGLQALATPTDRGLAPETDPTAYFARCGFRCKMFRRAAQQPIAT